MWNMATCFSLFICCLDPKENNGNPQIPSIQSPGGACGGNRGTGCEVVGHRVWGSLGTEGGRAPLPHGHGPHPLTTGSGGNNHGGGDARAGRCWEVNQVPPGGVGYRWRSGIRMAPPCGLRRRYGRLM